MIDDRDDGAKLAHAAVHYGLAKPDGQKCAACTHFRGKNDCEIVAAPIYPGGWCDRFESRAEEAAEPNNSAAEERAEASPDYMAHGRAMAGAKALHAVGHISAKERDKHLQASQAALGKPRKPFGSWAQ